MRGLVRLPPPAALAAAVLWMLPPPAAAAPAGETAARQRVGGTAGSDAALSLELGIEPDGDSACLSLESGLSMGAPRGPGVSLAYPLTLRTAAAAWFLEAGGPILGLRWAGRSGDCGIHGAIALALPSAPGLGDSRLPGLSAASEDRLARLSCRVGAGIASDPVALDAWISAGLRLSADWAGAPSLRAGLSLAHALNDVVSTALAAEVGAAAGAGPRGAPSFLGGAAASVSADAGPWGLDASLSLGLGGAPPRFALGLRLGCGRPGAPAPAGAGS